MSVVVVVVVVVVLSFFWYVCLFVYKKIYTLYTYVIFCFSSAQIIVSQKNKCTMCTCTHVHADPRLCSKKNRQVPSALNL